MRDAHAESNVLRLPGALRCCLYAFDNRLYGTECAFDKLLALHHAAQAQERPSGGDWT